MKTKPNSSVPRKKPRTARDESKFLLTEDELRASERKYRDIVSFAPVGIFQSLRDGTLITVNNALVEMLGYGSVDELLKINLAEIYLTPDERERLIGEYEERGFASDIVFRWKRKNDSTIWVQMTAHAIKDPAGLTEYFLGFIRDITENKRAEDSLRESEDRYRDLVENSNDLLCTHDLEGKLLSVNDAAVRLTGYQRKALLKMDMADLIEPEFRPGFHEYLAEIRTTGRAKGRLQIRTASGETRVWEYHNTLRTEGVAVPLVRGMAQDITERIKVGAALRQSEDDYRLLFQNNPQPMWAYDPETLAFLAVNDAAILHYGYSRDEFLTMTIEDIRPEEDIPSLIGDAANLPAGLRKPKLWRHRKKDGTIILGEINSHGSVFGGRQVRIVLVNDVTERHRAENERRVIFEIIQGVISIPNLDEFFKLVHRSIGQIVYAENCFVMLHDQATDMSHFRFWVDKYDPPPDPQPADKSFSNYVLRTGKPLLITKESRRQIIDAGEAEQIGSYSPSWIGVPLRTPQRTIGVLVLQNYEVEHAYTQRDLEFIASVGDEIALAIDRKRAEEALIESEERYRDLVENAIDIIYTHDLEGNYTSVNSAVEKITGYTQDEAMRLNMADVVAPEFLKKGSEMISAKLAGKLVTAYELELIAKDGHRVAVEVNSRLVYENGIPVGVQGIARDITERKRADEELRKSEILLKESQSIAGLGNYVLDIATGSWKSSDVLDKVFGIDKSYKRSIEGWEALIHPDDRSMMVDYVTNEVFGDRRAFDKEYRIIRHDNRTERWVHGLGKLELNAENVPVTMHGTILDITESKRANDALKLFRALVDHSNDTIEVLDPETGRFLDVNETGCMDLGYTREEYLALSVFDIDTTVAQPTFESTVEELRRSGAATFEGIHRRKDGSTFPVEVNLGYVSLDRDYMVAMVRNVTERKAAEEQLRLHATALESAANAIVIADRDGTILWVNPAFTEVTGYTLDEALGQNPRILKSGEFDAAYYETLWDTILSGQSWQGEIINRRKDGTTYFEEQTITPVLNDMGEVINFIAIKQNVTERKRAEEELIRSEERYRDLVENALDIIYTHDFDGNYTSASRAVEDILGYTIEEALTRNLADTVAPEYLEKALQMMADLIAGERSAVAELEIFAKDGRRVPVEVKSRLMLENGIPVGIQGVARDITERKHLEAQLLQSQKMESIGVLAGGVAHDFNNLLTAINGYSDLTLKRMSKDDPLRHNIEEVKHAGSRAAALTEQLLAFSRKKVLQPNVHNLNPLIADMEKMLRRIISENIELRTILDPALGNINADPGQIGQVVMNLTVNARDAMPAGGTITIETKNVALDEDFVSEHLSVSPGRFVRMTVSDTGEGMDEMTQQRIFEPFFSTKEIGKGTGLGLSTVFGIVKQSGGDIIVSSEVGKGTTFMVYLPRVDDVVEELIWKEKGGESDVSGSETILLVEDEEIVRNLVREILTINGYNVLETTSGSEALSICRTYPNLIHLLLTDVIMPKMSGSELKDEVVKLLPDIKVLFMSGYTDDAISESGILDSDTAFIEKPFPAETLARKIREVLGA